MHNVGTKSVLPTSTACIAFISKLTSTSRTYIGLHGWLTQWQILEQYVSNVPDPHAAIWIHVCVNTIYVISVNFYLTFLSK
jgi:hypothetical protein